MRLPLLVAGLALPVFMAMAVLAYLTLNIVLADRQSEAQFRVLKNRGVDAYYLGKWAEACEALREATSHKNDMELRRMLSKAERYRLAAEGDDFASQGSWRLAIAAYERALGKTKDEDIENRLATARTELAYSEWYAKALEAMGAGEWEAAIASLESALEAKACVRAEEKLRLAKGRKMRRDADQALEEKDWARAVAAAREAAELLRTKEATDRLAEAEAWLAYSSEYQKGLRAYKDKKLDLAVSCFERALKHRNDEAARAQLDQAQHDGCVERGAVSELAGDWRAAGDAYAEALRHADSESTRKSLARARHNEWAAVATQREKARDLMGAISAYSRALGYVPEEASKDALASAQKQLQYERALEKGKRCVEAEDWEGAAAAFDIAFEIKPTSEAVNSLVEAKFRKWREAGRASQKRGDWQGTVEAYAEALKLRDDPSLRKDFERASHEFKFDVAYRDGLLAFDEKRWQDAEKAFSAAVAIRPTDSIKQKLAISSQRRWIETAQVHEANCDWKSAMAAYKTALEALHDEKVAAALLAAEDELKYEQAMKTGETAAEVKDWRAAAEAFTKAVGLKDRPSAREKLNRAQFRKWLDEGEAKARTEDWDAAVRAFLEAKRYGASPELEPIIAQAQYRKWQEISKKKEQEGDRVGAQQAQTKATEFLKLATTGKQTSVPRRPLADTSSSRSQVVSSKGDQK